ncbi:hypothetical protein GCM10010232_62210 [Streptomyces amakusaensis]|uniref:Uncharacterized protein n=1 Tax=Streptomyces amakusaensis TaxID=67271 RepID=A0ABW0ATH1_9ACTN
MREEGWEIYRPEEDRQGSEWQAAYDAWHEFTRARLEQAEQQRRDALVEIRTEVWLSADTSRRVRALCEQTGLTPERLLAQLADHARLTGNGTATVAVAPFTPN